MPPLDIQSSQHVDRESLFSAIADAAMSSRIARNAAYETAHECLIDALARGFQALKYPQCARLMGPIVPGATMPGGARVPGTSFELDPVHGAFNNVVMLDWPGREPSQRTPPAALLGGVLAIADYIARRNAALGKPAPTIKDVLTATIRAREIGGALTSAGLGRSAALAVAASAVSATMLGGTRVQIIDAIACAWIDGGGSRANADVISRAIRHAILAIDHDRRAPRFVDESDSMAALHVPATAIERSSDGSMDEVIIGIATSADVHAHTAIEAGLTLHPLIIDRLGGIESIVIETQAPALQLVRSGALLNPFDRHACVRYMVSAALLYGRMSADDDDDAAAHDPRFDAIRSKVVVRENTRFTEEYYAADKRYIGNAVQVFFGDGSSTHRVAFDLPLGHRARRDEGTPLLKKKFEAAVAAHFSPKQTEAIKALFADRSRLEQMPVNEFVSGIVRN